MSDALGPYELNQIVTGDCRELAKAIPDESVDLVFTDPPYTAEFLPLYGWLAETAARVLKPSGFMFAYAGVYWKSHVMNLLADHMDYWFDMVLLNGGNSSLVWERRVVSRYKSLLVYCRPYARPRPRVMALSWFKGSGKDKRYHYWQQDESSARYYVDCFSAPGDVVLDPFCGGGTTPYVCKVLHRNWLAFEIDPATADVARERLKVVQPILFEPEQLGMGLF